MQTGTMTTAIRSEGVCVELEMQPEVTRLKELIGSAEEVIQGKEDNVFSLVQAAIIAGAAKELRRVLHAHGFIPMRQDDEYRKRVVHILGKVNEIAKCGLFIVEE